VGIHRAQEEKKNCCGATGGGTAKKQGGCQHWVPKTTYIPIIFRKTKRQSINESDKSDERKERKLKKKTEERKERGAGLGMRGWGTRSRNADAFG